LQSHFENELADTIGFLLAMSKYNGIEIEKVIAEKWIKWL